DYYIIGFDRPVSGLSVGSRVEYSGVRVGQVVDLVLNPDDPRLVRALIRVMQDTPVNDDTEANLVLANISGAMKIQLFGGSPASTRLDGRRDDPPLIIAEESAIGAVLQSSEGLINQVSDLLVSANRLLSDENIARVSETLSHLETSTRVLAESSDDIRRALSDFAQLGSEANQTLAAVQSLVEDSNRTLNDAERGLLTRAGDTITALERASRRVDRLLADNEASLNSGLQGVGELGPAIVELRSTLSNLDRITRRLEENPSGFLFRGEQVE